MKEIKVEKENGKESNLNIDDMNFIVQKNKAKCIYKQKLWKRGKYGLHYDFPKKSFLFSVYFDWIKANDCKGFCLKHSNCNLYTLWKIPSIQNILFQSGIDYKMSKNKTELYSKTQNTIVGEVWLVKDFPLSLVTIFPLLNILSNENPIISKFTEFLKNGFLSYSSLFPIKTIFPVAFAIRAQIQFHRISLRFYS